MSTYGDLYDYLEHHWGEQADKYSLELVESFCRLHCIPFGRVSRILRAWNGNDVFEVLMSLPGRVPRDVDVGLFEQTPAGWASSHGLYCRRVSTGWEPCRRTDKGATLALVTAFEQMFQDGIAGD